MLFFFEGGEKKWPMKLLWISFYFHILSCFFQVLFHWLLPVLSGLYTLMVKSYSLLSDFYKLALPLLWGLYLCMAIFKKDICLYAAFLRDAAAKLNHYQRVKLLLMWHLSWSISKIIVLWFYRTIDFHHLKSIYMFQQELALLLNPSGYKFSQPQSRF